MKKKILVTGANGQLALCLHKIIANENWENFDFFFADRSLLDISKKEIVESFFFTNSFDFVVNCAAYTAVDLAETDAENAFLANADAPGWMASETYDQGAKFIHISTDYVFNGESEIPYLETDSTNPINVYGKTKLQGELNALKNNSDSIIIRTAWVYADHGKNFYNTMQNLMQSREELNVVADQIGTPTNAYDLAKLILKIIKSNANQSGIYHYSNEGKISWFDFAEAIKEKFGFTTKITPIPTTQFPTPAKRPAFSLLNKEKVCADFNIEVPDWKESLFNL